MIKVDHHELDFARFGLILRNLHQTVQFSPDIYPEKKKNEKMNKVNHLDRTQFCQIYCNLERFQAICSVFSDVCPRKKKKEKTIKAKPEA